MDETAPAASSTLRSKESPSPLVSEPFLFNSPDLEEGGLTLCAGGIPNRDGHNLQRLLNSPSQGVFCLCSSARTGLRTQSFRDLSRRRQHLPSYSKMGRMRRGRHPKFRNLAPSRTVFLNGVQSFPFHAPRLPRQRLHSIQKLSLGGLGSGRP